MFFLSYEIQTENWFFRFINSCVHIKMSYHRRQEKHLYTHYTNKINFPK